MIAGETPASRAARPAPEPAWRAALCWMLRLVLGGLFGVAGALKLRDPASFAIEIHNYQLLPELAPALAATLPAIEITLGAALIVAPRPWVRAGALAGGALLAVFTVAVASVVARGVNITCGCFGSDSGPVTLQTVLRDLALVAAAAALYWLAADRLPAASAPASTPASTHEGRPSGDGA